VYAYGIGRSTVREAAVRTHPPRRIRSAADAIAIDHSCSDPRSDAELLALAKEDPGQFAHLFRRYLDPVHMYCHSLLGDRAAAEDATQTTFTKAYERLASCKDGATFRAWLFTIARNVVNDDYRSRRPMVPFEAAYLVPDGQPSPEDQAIRNDERLRIWTLLQAFKPVERDAIALRLQGLNDKEIASILGRSHGATRTMLSRVVQRLKTTLGGSTGEEASHADR
jgi:RNA polymerase sigma-70 factor (ECF subfamily)